MYVFCSRGNILKVLVNFWKYVLTKISPNWYRKQLMWIWTMVQTFKILFKISKMIKERTRMPLIIMPLLICCNPCGKRTTSSVCSQNDFHPLYHRVNALMGRYRRHNNVFEEKKTTEDNGEMKWCINYILPCFVIFREFSLFHHSLPQLSLFTALMHVREGTLDAYIRHCPQPCYPW